MQGFLTYVTSLRFLETILICIVAAILLYIIKKYLIKRVAYTNKDETHKNTLKGVVFNVFQYIILLGSIFLILAVNGLDVTGILTGLGIFATVVGLSLQDTLKDIITGINIYNNNFYKVGDVVMYEGNYWEVKFFNARVTKLKNQMDGSTYTIANSNVTQIRKVKELAGLVIRIDYSEDKDKIKEAFENMIPRVNDIYGVREATYIGAIDIQPDGVKHCLFYKVSPKYITSARLEINNIAYEELKKIGVSPSSDSNIDVKLQHVDNVEDVVKTKAKEVKKKKTK